MLDSLSSGISGMKNAQLQINVIGDNIANINTPGFKANRVTSEDSFVKTLASQGNSQIQVGSGVTTQGTGYDMTNGSYTVTGVATDLYIGGDGFFTVKDAAGTSYATRAGDFIRNSKTGVLETSDGLAVQGYSDSGLTTAGAVVIDGSSPPATTSATAKMTGFEIQTDGKIMVKMSDGTSFVRGQILLTNYGNPQALQRAGSNLFTGLDKAGASAAQAPGTPGCGKVTSNALEGSNVDLTTEFTSLITTQRAFQASARMITTSDELLQEMISLKR